MVYALALALSLIACGGGGSSSVGTTDGSGIANADLQGRRIFLAGDPWNTPIDSAAVDPNSNNLIASIGITTGLHPDFGANYNGGPFGIPYVVVSGAQKKVNVTFGYADRRWIKLYWRPTRSRRGQGQLDSLRALVGVSAVGWKLASRKRGDL